MMLLRRRVVIARGVVGKLGWRVHHLPRITSSTAVGRTPISHSHTRGAYRLRTLTTTARCSRSQWLQPIILGQVIIITKSLIGVKVHKGWVRCRTVHHAEGILPQGLARALGEEDVNAWLTLTVRGDYRWRGRRSGAGTAVGNFLRLVNAAIV